MYSKMKTAMGLAVGCGLMASALGAAPAMAAEDQLAETIREAAPSALETAERGPNVTANEVTVQIPDDPRDGVSASVADGASFTIGLPTADTAANRRLTSSGYAAFDNNNGSTTVPIVHDDGSLQVFTVIGDATAPNRYSYDLGLPAGATATAAADSSITVQSASGEAIGYIAAPWATDANGSSVPTRYELQGNTLTQTVDHDGAAYPVTADPWLGFKLISSTKWTKRDPRGNTLMITPTTFNRINSGDGNVLREGWNEVKKLRPTSNNTQMYWQYKCHFAGVPFKSTWNLDTWVKRKNYTDSVLHGCN